MATPGSVLNGNTVTPIGNTEPASVWADPNQHPRIQPMYLCRNGQVVSANYQNYLARLCNSITRYRSKELFVSPCNVHNIAASGSTNRWRFAAHTSPKCDTILVRAIIARTSNGATPFNPFIRLTITNAAGATLGFDDFYYGALLAVTDAPSEWAIGVIAIDSSAFRDTDIRCTFSDNNQSRIVAATVYEIAAEPLISNGYIPQNYAIGGAIYDDHRKQLEENAAALWKRGAAPVFSWSSDTDATAPSTANTSGVNLFDGSSATNTPNTPGFTIDLRYCNRVNSATVPCVFAACFSTNGIAASGVSLLDASGATLTTLGGHGALQWVTGTVNLPATLQKLDVIMAGKAGDTITVYAAGLYQHDGT